MSVEASSSALHAAGSRDDILVVMPVFDDWDCLPEVLERLERALASSGRRAGVLIVDDGSTRPPPEGLGARGCLYSVQLLELRCNLGHERAICVGLTHARRELDPALVVVMDADGEDRPEDVPRLLDELERRDRRGVVFAARRRRSESLGFRACYWIFQILHRLLVGRPIEVGSFSALPRRVLDALGVMPQFWSHYAAAVEVSRIPRWSIPTERGPRLRGRSHLDLVALVVHGMSVLSVYTERIAVRVFLASAILTVASLAMLAILQLGGAIGTAAPDGWAVAPLALLAGAMLASLVLAAALAIVVLGTRSRAHFLPVEGCAVYERGRRTL